MSEVMTAQELADRWGMSVRTLEQWRHKGQGPVFLKLCGLVAYRTKDILEYENNSARNSTSTKVNVIPKTTGEAQ